MPSEHYINLSFIIFIKSNQRHTHSHPGPNSPLDNTCTNPSQVWGKWEIDKSLNDQNELEN